MTIEIVDLPIENGGSFHSYVTVYQRVPEAQFLSFFTRVSYDVSRDEHKSSYR